MSHVGEVDGLLVSLEFDQEISKTIIWVLVDGNIVRPYESTSKHLSEACERFLEFQETLPHQLRKLKFHLLTNGEDSKVFSISTASISLLNF